jgi:hypothetical protein
MPDERYFSMPSAEVGGRCAQEPGFELLAVGAVVDPFARGGDPLAGRNGCGMADHGHGITMPARLGAQNAEAILSVVVSDTLEDRPALPGLMNPAATSCRLS